MPETPIKLTDIKNTIPVVIAILTLAGAFYAQSSKLDVTNERLQNLIDRLDKNENLYNDHETRLRLVESTGAINAKDIEIHKEDISEIKARLRI